ncbi:MAG TPA: aspartate--tRNA ligase [Oscillospiraceae bacterium]|nr:aspartate--tRNA ligase [Oscillospiraceae bacterium]
MEYRDRNCGEIRAAEIGQQVTLSGWVQRRRDHGKLIFLDLRDRSGLVQVVFNFEHNEAIFTQAEGIRTEFVVTVQGEVIARDPEAVNPKLATGEVEVKAQSLTILNKAKTPPFYIEDGVEVDENIRLKYRYLDLRRPEMLQNLILRHRVSKLVRDFLDAKGFLEVETPILTKSTPEGARDYLVPSRVNPGEFYALPQSPQLFKQLLMVSGVERYFQIARCFRDEDLRADRQPEFTQIDIELSFCSQEQILELMEQMMVHIYQGALGVEIPTPFPRMTYQEAMERFGSDKPDTRFALELHDISQLVAGTEFKVFKQTLAAGGVIKGINAKGCGKFSRREIDELTAFVAQFGAKGLAYLFVEEAGVRSPIAKFFAEATLANIVQTLDGAPGDLLLFVADEFDVACQALGALRLQLGERLGLLDENKLNFLWVVDFPLVDFDQDEGRYVAIHHPFTAPRDEDLPILESEPQQVLAKAYDLVFNGVEVGGGSLRIYQRELQERMFKLLGFSADRAREQFGFLLEAFDYGTPPHGGIAFGLDRLVMLMAGEKSIREVMAFPKTASASDLMTGAPSEVAPRQLKELHIQHAEKTKN